MKLKGKRVTLRTPEIEDLPILHELIYGEDHPEWKKFDAPYFPHNRNSYDRFSEQMKQKISSDAAKQMLIVHEENIIGMVTYYWEHEPSRWLEVGITIYSPKHWNGGFVNRSTHLVD